MNTQALKPPVVFILCSEIILNDGGYDSGGTYYGKLAGSKLFTINEEDSGKHIVNIRACNRKLAQDVFDRDYHYYFTTRNYHWRRRDKK